MGLKWLSVANILSEIPVLNIEDNPVQLKNVIRSTPTWRINGKLLGIARFNVWNGFFKEYLSNRLIELLLYMWTVIKT